MTTIRGAINATSGRILNEVCLSYVRLMHSCQLQLPEQWRNLKYEAVLNLEDLLGKSIHNHDGDVIDLAASLVIVLCLQIDEHERTKGTQIDANAFKEAGTSETVGRLAEDSRLESLLRSCVICMLNHESEQSIRYALAALKKLSGKDGVEKVVHFVIHGQRPLVREISTKREIDPNTDCLREFIIEYLKRSDSEKELAFKKMALFRPTQFGTSLVGAEKYESSFSQIDSEDEQDIVSIARFIQTLARLTAPGVDLRVLINEHLILLGK